MSWLGQSAFMHAADADEARGAAAVHAQDAAEWKANALHWQEHAAKLEAQLKAAYALSGAIGGAGNLPVKETRKVFDREWRLAVFNQLHQLAQKGLSQDDLNAHARKIGSGEITLYP